LKQGEENADPPPQGKRIDALSEKRLKIFYAYTTRGRGEKRIGMLDALDRVERLTEREVMETLPRLRFIRKGLEQSGRRDLNPRLRTGSTALSRAASARTTPYLTGRRRPAHLPGGIFRGWSVAPPLGPGPAARAADQLTRFLPIIPLGDLRPSSVVLARLDRGYARGLCINEFPRISY
jgi:hypothetical protein